MRRRRLGYGIAALTIAAMLLQALIGWTQDHPRSADLWAYGALIGLPATVFLILGVRGHRHVGWGFLAVALASRFAADHGLPIYWGYGGAFVLATVLTQIVPMREGPAPETPNEPPAKAPDEG